MLIYYWYPQVVRGKIYPICIQARNERRQRNHYSEIPFSVSLLFWSYSYLKQLLIPLLLSITRPEKQKNNKMKNRKVQICVAIRLERV